MHPWYVLVAFGACLYAPLARCTGEVRGKQAQYVQMRGKQAHYVQMRGKQAQYVHYAHPHTQHLPEML